MSEDIQAKQGQEITIWVELSGTPPPAVTWYHNGNILDEECLEDDDTKLVIENVTSIHAGVYQFEALNLVGTVRGQIRVFVLGAGTEKPISASANHTQSLPVQVCKWAEHVGELHNHGNREFRNQYKVGWGMLDVDTMLYQ